MRGLPAGWIAAPIGKLCSLNNGRAFKPAQWSDTGLPIVRIQNLNDPQAIFNHYSGEYSDRYYLKGGELLFAWSGTPGTSFGAHVWQGGEALLNQHIFRVDFDEKVIDKRFFRHAINQKLDELISKAHGGVGLRHVTKGMFERTEITVPPRAEQTRIADKLDGLLAKVRTCHDRLDHVPQILKKFRETVLRAAVSGRLTEEWRVKRGILTPEDDVVLHSVWENASYGTAAKSSKTGSVPVLRMGNIQDGSLDWRNLVYTSDKTEIAKYTLLRGDVLFNRTNSPQLVGKTAVYHGERPAVYAGYLIRVRCGSRLNSDYLGYCLNSPVGRQYCWTVKTDGVSQSNINASKLGAFRLMLPSSAEQLEIVRRVEGLFALSNSLQRRYNDALDRVVKFTPSVLAKAFRGKLVPQDPNDEPAVVLLERIPAAKSNEGGGSASPNAQNRRRHSSRHPRKESGRRLRAQSV